MEYLKQFFKSAVSKYVEVVRDDMITFGYDQGMEIRDLRLNTKIINDLFRNSNVETRLEFGRIGRMNLVYTPLPGIVTIQVKDLDIRVRPNFTGIALRKLVETLQELGDLGAEDFQPPTQNCFSSSFACPTSNCAYQPTVEVHNTQARLVHPCRIPRAPPVVRRARFVQALPDAPIHFQQPVRGSCGDRLSSCLPRLSLSSDVCLDKLCDLSLLSNTLLTSCGAANEKVEEKCQEIKNLFSNCVESVAGLTPPDYDELNKIKLPTLRVQTSSLCPANDSHQPAPKAVTREMHSASLHAQPTHRPCPFEASPTFSQQPTAACRKAPARPAIVIRPVAAGHNLRPQQQQQQQQQKSCAFQLPVEFSQPVGATATAQQPQGNFSLPGARLTPLPFQKQQQQQQQRSCPFQQQFAAGGFASPREMAGWTAPRSGWEPSVNFYTPRMHQEISSSIQQQQPHHAATLNYFSAINYPPLSARLVPPPQQAASGTFSPPFLWPQAPAGTAEMYLPQPQPQTHLHARPAHLRGAARGDHK